MSGTLFTWVGGQDINGANNWITPLDWTVAGAPATRAPTLATDTVLIATDNGSQDAIISGGQAITVASYTVSGVTVGTGAAAVQGGHLLVGGSNGVNGIGGGGGGSLTSLGAVIVTSTNSGGAIVGGIGGIISAPTMTVGGGPSGLLTDPNVLIGGGGTFDVTNMINNGGILADGGFFGLGALVLNDTAITGSGFLEVSGNSTMEINAATAQALNVLVSPGATSTVIFDQPANFTGSLNLINPNSNVDLFFKGETPTGVTFDPVSHNLIITGAGGVTLHTIAFTSNGVVPLAVTASTLVGFGEVVLGSATTPPTGTVALHGSHDQYTIANDGGSLFVQDNVANRDSTQILQGTTLMTFTDGTGVFDPTGSGEDVARLYLGALGRAPDVGGLEFWENQIDSGTMSLASVAQSFATSPEFITRFGALSNAAFVDQLYTGVLGRPSDPDGAAFWTGTLDGGTSRGDVLLDFTQSPEDKSHDLATGGDVNDAEAFRLYKAALNRVPDAGGQAFWSGQLAAGATPLQVAQGFVGSAEFQSLHATQLTAADFVTNLYQTVLNRAPDAGGLAFWSGVVAPAGTLTAAGEATAVLGFSDSIENRVQTASSTHANWVFIPA